MTHPLLYSAQKCFYNLYSPILTILTIWMKTIISQYQNVLISHFHEWSITGTTYGSPLVLGEKNINIWSDSRPHNLSIACHVIYFSYMASPGFRRWPFCIWSSIAIFVLLSLNLHHQLGAICVLTVCSNSVDHNSNCLGI